MASLSTRHIQPKAATQIAEPPIARFLFADTRMAWLWLIVRLYVGYQWITAGVEKLTGHSIAIGEFGESTGAAWVFNAQQGAAMKGFVMGALAQASGPHPAVQGWYAEFLRSFVLPNAVAFSYVSISPIIGTLALFLVLAWRVAGYYGIDRYLLPVLGTPWTGSLVHHDTPQFARK